MNRSRIVGRTALALGVLAPVLFASVMAQAPRTPAGKTSAEKAAAEYYVIVDTRSKKCTVVDKTPQVDSPAITLATDAIYRTHAEAETAMKSLKPCNAS